MPTLEQVRDRLARAGQDHLLRFHDRLDPDEQASLLRQIEALDLESLPDLIERYVRTKPDFSPPADLAPAPYFPADPDSSRRPWNRGAARERGEALIRAGKLACFVVAGGQGTRLGFQGPKGCYPAGAVSGKPLFQIFAEQIRAAQDKFQVTIPWYIMTSPMNHEDTIAFFRERDLFGLDENDVHFFPQGVMPSIDRESGRILLAEPGVIATNPDGHGGSITALDRSGALADIARRGIEHVSYFQIDNPLVKLADPVFLGIHAWDEVSSGEMASKMLPKRDPAEKVGVFCESDGRVRMIEYSDLPDDLARARRDDGTLRFNAGNPAIHLLGVAFLEKLNSDPTLSLPFHRADKKVPFVDLETGDRVEPDQPNAVKLERFVFDALPLAERSVILETDRIEEFAPIKNAEGADSPDSSRRLQTERAARWLEGLGVEVPRTADAEPDCTLEISPLTALDAEDLKPGDVPSPIERGAAVEI